MDRLGHPIIQCIFLRLFEVVSASFGAELGVDAGVLERHYRRSILDFRSPTALLRWEVG